MIGISVFGAYPKVRSEYQAIWLGIPVVLCLEDAQWRGNSFNVTLRVMEPVTITCQLTGGASSGHGLSQNLMSQLLVNCLDLQRMGVNLSLLCDFIFDQLYSFTGAYRQTPGWAGGAWLTGSDVEAMANRLKTVAEFLGALMTHPAALNASRWGYEPFSGSESRVTPSINALFQAARVHIQSSGYLAVDSQSPCAMAKVPLVEPGWVVTGKRGGLEKQAREQAMDERRPLVVVSRQEEVIDVIPFISCKKVIKPAKGHLGAFRLWLLEQTSRNVVPEGAV